MDQLKFDFKRKNLEQHLEEFSEITTIWEAFEYANTFAKRRAIRMYKRYYVPTNMGEMKRVLKQMYSESKTDINKMNSKQTRMVYHTIMKLKNS